jgi:hypothetical protein
MDFVLRSIRKGMGGHGINGEDKLPWIYIMIMIYAP